MRIPGEALETENIENLKKLDFRLPLTAVPPRASPWARSGFLALFRRLHEDLPPTTSASVVQKAAR